MFLPLSAVLLSAATADSRILAVLELRNRVKGPDRDAIDAPYLTDLVRTAALRASGLGVMTRENVVALLTAQGKRLEDCEGECEVDTGRRLGAEQILSGDILKYGGGYRASLRLHDTQRGELLNATQANGNTPEELEGALLVAVRELFRAQPAAASGRRRGVRFVPEEWAARSSMGLLAVEVGAVNALEGTATENFSSRMGARAGLRLGTYRFFKDFSSTFGVLLGGGAELTYFPGSGSPYVSAATCTGVTGAAGPILKAGTFRAADEWFGAVFGLAFNPMLGTAPGRRSGGDNKAMDLYLGAELFVDVATIHPEGDKEVHVRFAANFRNSTQLIESTTVARLTGATLALVWY